MKTEVKISKGWGRKGGMDGGERAREREREKELTQLWTFIEINTSWFCVGSLREKSLTIPPSI